MELFRYYKLFSVSKVQTGHTKPIFFVHKAAFLQMHAINIWLCALPSSSQSRTTSSLHSHRQPRCRRCACHQLPRLPVAHQPGWKAASARGQVHCLQWSYSKWRLHHHRCRQTKTVTVQHSTFLCICYSLNSLLNFIVRHIFAWKNVWLTFSAHIWTAFSPPLLLCLPLSLKLMLTFDQINQGLKLSVWQGVQGEWMTVITSARVGNAISTADIFGRYASTDILYYPTLHQNDARFSIWPRAVVSYCKYKVRESHDQNLILTRSFSKFCLIYTGSAKKYTWNICF